MRKGFKRLITIMFIPHSQRSSFNLQLPLTILYSFILLLIIATVLSGLFVFRCSLFSQTKKANLVLSGELTKFRETMNDVRGLEAKLRVLTGSSQDTEIATGGPTQESPQALRKESFIEREERSLSELEKELGGKAVGDAFLPSISPVAKGWTISESQEGLELVALPGSEVRTTAKGRVLCASEGRVIVDHGGNLKTEYTNLGRVTVKVGEQIGKGETIGYLGEERIFYQVQNFDKKVNPLSYMGEWR